MTATKGHDVNGLTARDYSDADPRVLEALYDMALGAVAGGATKTETLEAMGDAYGTRATVADIEREAVAAYRDALSVDVDPEDIDDSWRGGRTTCA